MGRSEGRDGKGDEDGGGSGGVAQRRDARMNAGENEAEGVIIEWGREESEARGQEEQRRKMMGRGIASRGPTRREGK